ncbi:AAA family ATPase [Moraxella osloensis]|jgi:chromosome partitioning protein|uniref:Chromosome partitioning protein ParA n=1 Tax=Faucicola osloensis TaxID=34062 RepID=A0A2D2LXV8_FAUOS|nr:AAA family ATPase [Moraxella osloensis]ATR79864.1 chromosome partitioning protein ParA [Moraxella osloensis]
MIILIGGEKGGSGKSCLAQNIAVYLQNKDRDILLLDADPQGTTTDWVKEREQNQISKTLPSVQCSGNIRQTLIDLSKRYQDIVIDAGGQDSEALRSAMTVATHMLLPFRPKRRDLKTLAHMENLVKMAKAINPNLDAKAVMTQCPTLPSQFQRITDAKDACESFNIPALQNFTSNRNIYDDADENGFTVFEAKGDTDGKANAEIVAIVEEFLGEV